MTPLHGNTPSGSSGWRSPSPEWLVSVSPINYPSSPSWNKYDSSANSAACDPPSPGNADVSQTISTSDTIIVRSKRKRSLSSTSPVTQPPVKRTPQAAATVLLVPGPKPERHPSISAWSSMNFLWSCIEVTQDNAAKLSAIRALDGFIYTAEQEDQRGTKQQLFVHYMALAAYFLAVGHEVNVEVISWEHFLQVIKTTPERLYVYSSVFVRMTDEVDDLSAVALLDDLALRRTFRSEMLQLVDKTILLPPLGSQKTTRTPFGPRRYCTTGKDQK
ncbi:hypothetical protein BDZ89DRAFT_259664 [Hymenopellis radicata]|nr:hypothetical protein BDZ89DRAFT_259664 [Hymenopellis radicata]